MTEAVEDRAAVAAGLVRGVRRAFGARGYGTLTEFSLKSGRRADVIGLGRDGRVVIVEVKSSAEDFRADNKWPDYRAYCDAFYFAVAEGFPRAILPPDTGLIVADPYDAAFLREAPEHPLHASRRRALTLRFARTASARLWRVADADAAIDIAAGDDP